ncbi:hypothetical protein ACLKA7_005363 [Drosophila subpalustris]
MDELETQIVVHVAEKRGQLLLSVTIRHNDGRTVSCTAFLRLEFAALSYLLAPMNFLPMKCIVDKSAPGNHLPVAAVGCHQLRRGHIRRCRRQQRLLDVRLVDVVIAQCKSMRQKNVHNECQSAAENEQVIDMKTVLAQPY